MYETRQHKEATSRVIQKPEGKRGRMFQFMDNRRGYDGMLNIIGEIPKICIQAKYPVVDIAEKELNNNSKREMLFEPKTQKMFNEVRLYSSKFDGKVHITNDGKMYDYSEYKIYGNVEYAQNPRSSRIDNTQTLLDILKTNSMADVIKTCEGLWTIIRPDNNTEVAYKSPENIAEYTYLFINPDFLFVAPNPSSGSTRFVHPMLCSGWPNADAAGTLKVDTNGMEDIITITNDSGHYQFKSNCLATVYNYIFKLLNHAGEPSTKKEPESHNYRSLRTGSVHSVTQPSNISEDCMPEPLRQLISQQEQELQVLRQELLQQVKGLIQRQNEQMRQIEQISDQLSSGLWCVPSKRKQQKLLQLKQQKLSLKRMHQIERQRQQQKQQQVMAKALKQQQRQRLAKTPEQKQKLEQLQKLEQYQEQERQLERQRRLMLNCMRPRVELRRKSEQLPPLHQFTSI